MKKLAGMLAMLFLAPLLAAQENPLTDHGRTAYKYMKLMLHSSIERMPAEHFGFKPADDVRTYAELLGHIAESQYIFCSRATGEKNPAPKIVGVRTTKSELAAAMKEATAYCDAAYGAATDAKAAEMVEMHRGEMPRFGVLNANLLHTVQHYGNVITYLRIKGIVPPSSDPQIMKQVMED